MFQCSEVIGKYRITCFFEIWFDMKFISLKVVRYILMLFNC